MEYLYYSTAEEKGNSVFWGGYRVQRLFPLILWGHCDIINKGVGFLHHI
jgi:hypothetical protein